MSDFQKKIESLHKAFQHFKEGIYILKHDGYKTPNLDTFIWRIEKAVNEADREILNEMQKEMDKF